MRTRKLFTVLVAAASVAGTLLVAGPAGPAAAAGGTCSLQVPSKAAIISPYRGFPATLGSDCAANGVLDTAWSAYHPSQGLQAVLYFEEGSQSEIWDLYDFEPLGKWTWRPDFAYDANYDESAQNQPVSDVRVGSRAALAATRTGSTVKITTRATRYAVSMDTFIPWTGSRGTVQQRTSSSAPWTGLKYVYPDRNGYSGFSYTASSAREYRVVFPDATYIWGTASSTVRR